MSDFIQQKTVNSYKCNYCGQDFQRNSHYHRSYCSRKCQGKACQKENAWSEAEIEQLKSMSGYHPIQEIVDKWDGIAKKNSWKKRTPNAIRVKFKRLPVEYKSYRASLDNWSMSTIAVYLDIVHDRIQQWELEGLKIKRYSHDGERAHKTAVSQNDLKYFAVHHPELFWGIDAKKLGKLIKDNQLAQEICAVANQPTTGRAMTVVRLDNGEVYPSARSAATTLDVQKSIILKCCKRDTPCRNGMDWAQLDYPVYWVPFSYRKEFNQLAGQVVFQLYTELSQVNGFKKSSCLVICVRMAVQISLSAFRRKIREPQQVISLSAVSDFWIDKVLNRFKKNTNYNNSFLHELVKRNVMHRIKWFFDGVYGYSSKATLHLEEFANTFINDTIAHYFKKSCLPKYWKPTNHLEYVDIYSFVEGSVYVSVYEDKKKRSLLFLKALYYMRKNKNEFSYRDELIQVQTSFENDVGIDATYEALVEVLKNRLSLPQLLLDKCLEYLRIGQSGEQNIIDTKEEKEIMDTLKQAALLIDCPF